MGEQTFVNTHRPIQAAQQPRSTRLHMDVPLLLAVFCLVVFGLLMVYSASWNYALRMNQPPSYVLTRQLIWAVVGSAAAIFLSFFNYHRYQRWILPIMGGTLVMLVAVLWINDNPTGPTRTLFNGSIQPSELAKLVTVIYLSVWLNSKRDQLNNISFGLFPMMAILGLMAGLIVLQPDLSAAATIIIIGGLLFFLADVDWRQIVLVLVVVILLGWVVVSLNETGRVRLESYLQGFQNPENASYHVKRSLEAVVRGGVFGVGIGKGSTKFTGLPVPWTDSIFAVITEEIGLLGALGVVSLYLVFLWRGLLIARQSPDYLGKLLASGITLWIVAEALINISVMINLLPIAGNALPLISAGGSSMVMTLAGIGILMNVARRSKSGKSVAEGRSFGAVVDLRRRDRRRRISRPGSPPGARR